MAKFNGRKAEAYYRHANEACARIVLKDPDRFGGPGSLMVMWACAVLQCDASVVEKLKVRAGLEGRTETSPQQ